MPAWAIPGKPSAPEQNQPVLFIQKRWLRWPKSGSKHTGRSKLVDEFKGMDFDLVVTVCDSAAEECPIWLGTGKRVHHSFPDPAKTDTMEDFRNVRDDIELEITKLLKQIG